jgi:hypothetical protein
VIMGGRISRRPYNTTHDHSGEAGNHRIFE